MTFTNLGLSAPLLRAISDNGYTEPTPIQSQAIPAILSGRDVMAAAQTGTGKTASFGLPLLQRLSAGGKAGSNQVRALVLAPTRELAVQVEQNISSYAKHLPLRTGVVYGGVKINPQMQRLRKGVDLLVATPGRLLDLAGQNAVRFDRLESLVLDEADRMLDMGFRNDLNRILNLLPAQRQNLLFSATFCDAILTFTKGLLQDPQQINVSPRNGAAKSVKQAVYVVDKSKKKDLLSHLITQRNWSQVLVFTKTKRGADQLVRQLKGDNLSAVAIHGNKSQGVRTRALADFKANKTRILVATDIAARGIDISGLPQVVNFNLPQVAEDYVHRIGRTGRAGLTGEAISLVSADEAGLLGGIETLIKQSLVREVEAGFVPTHKVPQTGPSARKPGKAKRPQRSPLGQAVAKSASSRGPAKNQRADQRQGKSGELTQKPAAHNRTRRNSRRNSQPAMAGQQENRRSTR